MIEFYRIALVTSCTLMLAACASAGAQAGKVIPKRSVAAVSVAPSSAGAPVIQYGAAAGGGHTVLAGDTLWSIAQKYGVGFQTLLSVNHIAQPHDIHVGDRLILPPPDRYRVRAGDQVASIARAWGVSSSEIIALNNLRSPYHLTPGTELRLSGERAATGTALAPVAIQIAEVQAAPVIDNNKLARVVVLPPPRGGMHSLGTLTVPAPVAAVKRAVAQPAVVAPVMATRTVALPALKSAVAVPASALAASFAAPLTYRSSSRFLTPVNGPVISNYGAKANGLYNDGVNIGAPRGTPVRAAENGKIIYVGQDVAGFGTLMLVRHPDNYITAYGHLDRTLGTAGQPVRRGQTIGTVGSTGNADRPQVHFEIRQGRQPVNPLSLT